MEIIGALIAIALVLVLVLTVGPGQTTYGKKTGFPLRVSADGNPEYKVGGITIDWTDVNIPTGTAGTGITLGDGTFVPPGKKYLRYGQVVFWTVTAGKTDAAKVALTATGLVRDRVGILNETVVEDDVMSDHAGGCIIGGKCFRGRVQVGGAWPTEANLLAAVPRLVLVDD